jgi:Flp pilus assembly protein TadG
MSARAYISNGLRNLRDLWCGVHPNLPEAATDQSDCGAALVEFTILMPVFFLILFGIIEFGSIIWTENNMTNAAREGARTSAVQGGTMAQANAVACQWLNGSGMTFSISSTDKCPGNQDVNVQVSISKANASLMNTYFSLTGSGGLTASTWGGSIGASVTMRKELTCGATAAAATCSCNTSGATPSGC